MLREVVTCSCVRNPGGHAESNPSLSKKGSALRSGQLLSRRPTTGHRYDCIAVSVRRCGAGQRDCLDTSENAEALCLFCLPLARLTVHGREHPLQGRTVCAEREQLALRRYKLEVCGSQVLILNWALNRTTLTRDTPAASVVGTAQKMASPVPNSGTLNGISFIANPKSGVMARMDNMPNMKLDGAFSANATSLVLSITPDTRKTVTRLAVGTMRCPCTCTCNHAYIHTYIPVEALEQMCWCRW